MRHGVLLENALRELVDEELRELADSISEPPGGGEQGGRCASASGGHLPRPVPAAPVAGGEETAVLDPFGGRAGR